VTGYEAGHANYRSKLLAMGLTRGTVVRMVRLAPLGDPVEIEVRGFRLTLRKSEADVLVLKYRS
jgi:ferrous iron transport protein A